MDEKEIQIPLTYINEWYKAHNEFLPCRAIKFMIQDYKFEVLGIKPERGYILQSNDDE